MDVKSNEKFASLTISSGSLIPNKIDIYHANYTNVDLHNTPVALNPVPDSLLIGIINKIIPEKWLYVKNSFPLYTGKKLPYHLSVRSTVLNISVINR